MKVSVVVPFLNEDKYIERCARSLLDQDFDRDEYEIIFIDNGSGDESAEIIRKYPGIVLLREEQAGSYAARNRGIGVAKGEVIAFTDGDCEVSKDWVTRIYTGMESTRASIVLGTRRFNSDESAVLQMFEDYENAKVQYILEMQPQKRYCFGFTNNMAVKAELFERIGLFCDVRRGGDTEFVQRYVSSGHNTECAFLPGMAVLHLEIANIADWLKKQRIRGGSNRGIGRVSDYRNLSLAARLKVFRYCVRRNNYPLMKSFSLFVLLLIGNLFYRTG